MEDILSSIKRIIAEEGEPAPTRPRRQTRAPARPVDPDMDEDGIDEVLELNDPMPGQSGPSQSGTSQSGPAQSLPIQSMAALAAPEPVASPVAPPATSSDPEPEPMPSPSPRTPPPASAAAGAAAPEPIVSQSAAAATRGSLDSLARMMVKPDPASDGTLEGLVREMLRPMLREWLDANLPGMVESMVTREIAKITGRPE